VIPLEGEVVGQEPVAWEREERRVRRGVQAGDPGPWPRPAPGPHPDPRPRPRPNWGPAC